MGLVIRNKSANELEFEIDKVEFDIKQRGFKVTNLNDGLETDLIRYPLKPPEKHDNNIEILFYYKENCYANDIYPLYLRELENIEDHNGRVGWIFPLQALLTDQHDYSENEHFLKYAYSAFYKILVTKDIPHRIPPNEPQYANHILENNLPENLIIVAIHKNHTEAYENILSLKLNLANYNVDLLRYGYFPIDSENGMLLHTYKDYYPNYLRVEGKRLRIKCVSKHLIDDPYLATLVKLLPFQKEPLIKFHFLYQILELLIEIVLKNEIEIIMKELTTESEDIFVLKKKLSKVLEEEHRLLKLVGNYSQSIDYDSMEDLRIKCNELIITMPPNKEYMHSIKAIYKTRNILFHNYRKIPQNSNAFLNEVNWALQRVVLELVLNFSKLHDK